VVGAARLSQYYLIAFGGKSCILAKLAVTRRGACTRPRGRSKCSAARVAHEPFSRCWLTMSLLFVSYLPAESHPTVCFEYFTLSHLIPSQHANRRTLRTSMKAISCVRRRSSRGSTHIDAIVPGSLCDATVCSRSSRVANRSDHPFKRENSLLFDYFGGKAFVLPTTLTQGPFSDLGYIRFITTSAEVDLSFLLQFGSLGCGTMAAGPVECSL
jgi:hypothetical protein